MGKIVFSLMVLVVALTASIIEKKSAYDFKTTVSNLVKNIKQSGFTIYAEINHRNNAKTVKSYSNNSVTIIFDNPKDTARIMMHDSKAAYALPQKVFIYENLDDETIVMYESFKDLKNKFAVQNCMIIDGVSSKIDRKIYKIDEENSFYIIV